MLRFLLLAVSVPTQLLFLSCQPTTSPTVNFIAHAEPSAEKFCGAEVRPRQLLVKLSGCQEVLDAKYLNAKLQTVLRSKIDETLVTEQVGSGCLFLAQSTRKSFADLSVRFEEYLHNSNEITESLDKDSGNDNLRLEYVEPNFIIHVEGGSPDPALREPNDDHYVNGDMWGLVDMDAARLSIDAPHAWGYSTGSDSIVVGIVDSGIYAEHPDLIDNMWTATKPITVVVGGRKFTCDPGTHGYDATAQPGEECYPGDRSGHGSMVAGIIGARGNNSIGVVGVNWNIKLIALKVADASGSGDIRYAINAIEFVLQAQNQLKDDLNLKVLNNSWGYEPNSTTCAGSNSLREEIDKLRSRGVLFVASAGESGADNDQKPHLPSGFDLANIISVTALDRGGQLTTVQQVSSNVGKTTVHLAAPGDDIWTTCLPHKGFYCQASFTSAASPFVSGTAALMFSIPQCAALGAEGIKSRLLAGAIKTPSMVDPVSHESLTVTGGRLNAFEAILACDK